MRILKFPDEFCANSRPYWILFFVFILSNILLIHTLYTRQPERYRRMSRWFSLESSSDSSSSDSDSSSSDSDSSSSEAQAAVFTTLGRTVEFGGMTLRDASAKHVRKRDPGADRYGVEVLSISKRSVPYLSGMRRGDVIVSINRMPTYTVTDFEQVAQNLDTSQGILFDVYRNGRFYYMTVETRNAVRW